MRTRQIIVLLTISSAALCVIATAPAQELIHHWKLDESSGLVAADSAGDLDLTLVGFDEGDLTSHWVAGQHGGGLRFDGVDDNGFNSTGVAPFTTATDHSVAMWIKYDAANVGATQRWLSWGGNDGFWGRYYMGIHESGDFSVGIGAGTVHTADDIEAPSTETFEHWASVREGDVVRIYRNGEEVSVASMSNINGDLHPVSEALPFTLGRLGNSYAPDTRRFTDGVIDDVAIWNGALTLEQITDVINVGAAGDGSSFRITEIIYDQETQQFTITWNSTPGESYGLYFSSDGMASWGSDVSDSIDSEGETTTFGPFDNPGVGSPSELFFRVEKQ